MSEASRPAAVVGAEGLTKRFGPRLALDRIDLEVQQGDFFAILRLIEVSVTIRTGHFFPGFIYVYGMPELKKLVN